MMENSDIIRRIGEQLLDETSGKGAPQGKESWCQDMKVQEKKNQSKERNEEKEESIGE